MQAVTDEAYRGAEELLVDHRDLLDEIANRLLQNEVIERDEIREILTSNRDIAPPPVELGEPRPGTPAEALVSRPPPEPPNRGA